MNWDTYWDDFVEKNRLQNHIQEMNMADEQLGHELRIKDICHMIYDDYENCLKNQLEQVRADFLQVLETFRNVHLQKSRVKSIESILWKIIHKRYHSLINTKSKYVSINADNYNSIITDLIGMRIILNYRGNWTSIHDEIIKCFPYPEEGFQGKGSSDTLEHLENGDNLLVQNPTVYYAEGDTTEEYEKYGLNVQLHKKGYRSIHYIVSYQKVYIEIQIRTIYDEAWSDCDHNYVYKKDDNMSHTALEKLSHILSELTNVSNDIGDSMKDIFDNQSFRDVGNETWETSEEKRRMIKEQVDKVKAVYQDFLAFYDKIQIKQEVK